jgi:hypothetical protein
LEHANAAPPLVGELIRLLELRARWNGEASTLARGPLTEGDLLALAFLLSEIDVSSLLVDDPGLLDRLRRAQLPDFVQSRAGRPLQLSPLPDSRPAGPGGGIGLCIDARRELPVELAQGLGPIQAVVLYGLHEPVSLGTFSRLEARLGRELVLLSLGGRALALWNVTAAVVVQRSGAAAAREALERLSALLADRSLDPLSLAETCFQLRSRQRSRGEGELARLTARTDELEEEIADLKERLMKQQRSLAIYNEIVSATDRRSHGPSANRDPEASS